VISGRPAGTVTYGYVCRSGPNGQGDAERAAGTAMRMLDQATGMESRRIQERIISIRDAISGMSDGRASAELAERVADVTGAYLRAR
jgi:hypothetical protein